MDKADLISISTALDNSALTFLVGTGLSRYLTDDKIPNWQELLELCGLNKDKQKFAWPKCYDTLFMRNEDNDQVKLKDPTITCAQILQNIYKKNDMDIKKFICETIKKRSDDNVNLNRVSSIKDFFDTLSNDEKSINVITANYDCLIQNNIFNSDAKVVYPNTKMIKKNCKQNLYHIHGCIDDSESLVFGVEDYFE